MKRWAPMRDSSEPNQDARHRVEELKASHTTAELKEQLGEKLSPGYSDGVPASLKNEFMQACFEQLAPNGSLTDRLKTHPSYTPDWRNKGRKHNLATALRLLLTERVGRESHAGITSLDKTVLAELIVAMTDGDEILQSGPKDTGGQLQEDAPERPTPNPIPFTDTLDLEHASEDDLQRWVDQRRSNASDQFAVYVLDCTPPVDTESPRITALRSTAATKVMNGKPMSEVEQAAAALNEGERLFYVGFTADVATRLKQHQTGAAAAGADFTNLFAPQKAIDVAWYADEAEARRQESIRAEELAEPGEFFTYFN